MKSRSCPYCGKPVAPTLINCPYCREAIPREQALKNSFTEQGRKYMRRGLLYTLMAGVVYYFAGGFSPMTLPVSVPPAVNQYFTPLFFALGLGLVLYGLFLYMRG
jgi:hypothetical protein